MNQQCSFFAPDLRLDEIKQSLDIPYFLCRTSMFDCHGWSDTAKQVGPHFSSSGIRLSLVEELGWS